MKGNCETVKCQICQEEMSFGRIKRHVKTQHPQIKLKQYLKQYWYTLPLHAPCQVCKEKIVYKYKTCSKECRSKLEHGHKGKPKRKGFMSEDHRNKLSKSMLGKPGGFTGHKHTEEFKRQKSKELKNKKLFLNHTHSKETIKILSQRKKEYYSKGNEPWTKNNKHTLETISKIISHRPMNKLEKLVSNILTNNKIEYYHQFFLNKKGIIKSYDFKIKGKKILLEIDGDYYHGGPGCKKHFFKVEETKQNDKIKNKLAKDKGYKIIRIWESEIKNNPNIILEKLNGYL